MQLLPTPLRPAAGGLQRHGLLLGTQTSGQEPDALLLGDVVVQGAGASGGGGQLTEASGREAGAGGGHVRLLRTFPHPLGDVDRARYMPQRPRCVAVKCMERGLSLYDLGPDGDDGNDGAAPPASAAGVAEPAEGPGPALVMQDARQDGPGLAFSGLAEGRLLSGLSAGCVGVYDAGRAGGGGGGGQLREVAVHTGGHAGAVNDVAWSASPSDGPHVFASAGDDGAALLWDERQAPPAHRRVARSNRPLQSLAFCPARPQLLATCGDNQQVGGACWVCWAGAGLRWDGTCGEARGEAAGRRRRCRRGRPAGQAGWAAAGWLPSPGRGAGAARREEGRDMGGRTSRCCGCRPPPPSAWNQP